ncbi:MAG: HAD-IB family hydrolase [Candidatus Dormibacteraeota bacterium]|nr:HAD-IB family hydrolase [Candidatus Dormibacteraeota bacterium]
MVAEQDRPTRRVAAFFDVDRTLLRGSSLLHVARPMRRDGFMPTRVMFHAVLMQARFSASGFDEVQIHDAVRGVGALVAGIDSDKLLDFARQAIPRYVAPRVYAEARARIDWHRGRGHLVFLVSSSPEEFITVLGSVLGVDGVAGTEAELRDGRYTGRILRLCHGAGKADVIQELAAANDVDLRQSYAYGDSFASDLLMLEVVGHPVCVNGDRLLTAHAQRLGWPVERFQRAILHPGSAGLRRLPRRVASASAPAVRRAQGHVRNTARALREL